MLAGEQECSLAVAVRFWRVRRCGCCNQRQHVLEDARERSSPQLRRLVLSARPRQLAVDARLHGAAVGAGAHGARPAGASRKREGVTTGRVLRAGITVAAPCKPLVDRIGADADQYSDILARQCDEERAVAARVGESWPTNKAALLPQGLASRSGLQCSRGLCESANLGWLQELEQE